MVPLVRLEAIISGMERIDLIKMDIEGMEYRVLAASWDALAKQRPMILTEYSPRLQQRSSGVQISQYLGFLLDKGYYPTVLVRNGPPQELPEPELERVRQGVQGLLEEELDRGGTHLDILFRAR
jgi:hypothetical protein